MAPQRTRDPDPTASIGVPVYNGENTIGRALDSLLAQTYGDLEIVISDNASTDRTGQICRQYAEKDRRIRYMRQEQNLGPVPNFEQVLHAARGSYFMWAAADDKWSPAYLERMIQALEVAPEALCSVSKVRFSDGRLSNATATLRGTPRERVSRFLTKPDDNSRFYGVYRTEGLRRVVQAINWDFWGGDWLLVAAVAIAGDVIEVPEILMEREAAESTKYCAAIPAGGRLSYMFPLSTFTKEVLKFKEAWTPRGVKALIIQNLVQHVRVAKFRGWRIFVFYRWLANRIRPDASV